MFTELQSLGGLGEFSKVIQTLDFFSGLHNCLEFSQPTSCLDDYVNEFIMGYVTSFWELCDTLSRCFINGASVYILRCLICHSSHTTASSPSKLCGILKTALV